MRLQRNVLPWTAVFVVGMATYGWGQIAPNGEIQLLSHCGCDAGCCDDGCCDSGCDSGCCSSGGCDSGCGHDGFGLLNHECGFASRCCKLGEPFKLWNGHGCRKGCPIVDFGGWTQFGYHDEQTPLSTTFNDGLAFNDRRNTVNLHQQWFYAEKTAESKCCEWDWGFRADMMYGVDAQKTQAFGNPPGSWDFDNGFDHGAYGWAIPQLYGELARGDLSVKAGHFFTLVGYEVVTAPGNFFYSHSLTMFNSEPFTHTGVLATYSGYEDLDVYAGWTLGWDTGFDNVNGGSSLLGGFSATLSDDVTFTYIATAGNFGARGEDAYSHSVVLDMQLTERVNYVLQSDYLQINSVDDDDVGINQYLFYKYSDCIAFGGRMEWWKNDGDSYYAATGGVNIRTGSNLVIRPEVRQDWQPANNFDETIGAIDVILTY